MNKRILLIEDDPLVLKSLINLLQSRGYGVTGCESGFEAVSAFKNRKFDLIISDIRMSGQDGISTVKAIRDIETGSGLPGTPIIMITGYADSNAPIDAIKIGVQDYFLKPFDNNELIRSVETHLAKAESFVPKGSAARQSQRFSVLGVGIVSPFGLTKEAFWEYVNGCCPTYRQFSNGKYSELEACLSMRVKDFTPSRYFDEKQLHNLDDNSAFIAAAAKFAIEDSGLKVSKIGSDDVGVAVGTSISIATSMSDYDESVLKFGSRRSSIGIFPNTVICAPASRVSIFEHITGSNTTLTSGMNSGMDAIGYALLCLEDHQAKIMIAGGGDALSEKILLGYSKEGLLFRNEEVIRANKRGAFIPSEGACCLVIGRHDEERPEPQVFCQILSYATGFSPFKKRNISQRAETVCGVLKECLEKANLEPANIDGVLMSSYYDEFDYQTELLAIRSLLGNKTDKLIFIPKKILGESFSVYGPEAVVLAIGLFEGKITRQAMEYLNVNKQEARTEKFSHILIVDLDSAGHQSGMVLKSSRD